LEAQIGEVAADRVAAATFDRAIETRP